METWRPVVGYEGIYEVSDLGRVKRVSPNTNSKKTPLKPGLVSGYHGISLCKNGKRTSVLVHRVVAASFLGNVRELVVNHKNGDKTDNRLCNIELVTRLENERHKWDVLKTGARSSAKLNQRDADDIRRLRKSGMTLKQIAKIYGVYFTNIHHIVTNKTWCR